MQEARGRERPPTARRGFGTPNGTQNGVAPGHRTVLAASLSLVLSHGKSPHRRCLRLTAGGTRSRTIARACFATNGSAFSVVTNLREAFEEAETMG